MEILPSLHILCTGKKVTKKASFDFSLLTCYKVTSDSPRRKITF